MKRKKIFEGFLKTFDEKEMQTKRDARKDQARQRSQSFDHHQRESEI